MVDFENAMIRFTRSFEDLAASRDRLAHELEHALSSALAQIEMLDSVLQGQYPLNSGSTSASGRAPPISVKRCDP